MDDPYLHREPTRPLVSSCGAHWVPIQHPYLYHLLASLACEPPSCPVIGEARGLGPYSYVDQICFGFVLYCFAGRSSELT